LVPPATGFEASETNATQRGAVSPRPRSELGPPEMAGPYEPPLAAPPRPREAMRVVPLRHGEPSME